MASCSNEKPYTIQGRIELPDSLLVGDSLMATPSLEGWQVYMLNLDGESIDSVEISDNQFVFQGEVNSKDPYFVYLASDLCVGLIAIEPGDIEVVIDAESLTATGTPVNDMMIDIDATLLNLQQDTYAEMAALTQEYGEAMPDSLIMPLYQDYMSRYNQVVDSFYQTNPEGLAAVVTIVLSIGMTKMAQNNAIVKRLLAVETLGCVDVICSDKTGTLTQNQMTVKVVYDGLHVYDVEGNGYAPEGRLLGPDGKVYSPEGVSEMLCRAAVLCNDASIVKGEDGSYSCIGDPTEGALTTLGSKCGMLREEMMNRFKRVKELPFDSDRKMMTTYNSGIVEGKLISFTKGAPDIVLSRCAFYMDKDGEHPMTPEYLDKITKQNHEFASKAIRVLAFAYRTHDNLDIEPDFSHEKDMVFVGLIGMIDPEREEAKAAIAVCREAGIRTVMITGDFKDSAVAIGNNLNMMGDGAGALSGSELDKMSDEDLRVACETTNVYARVSPEHKVKIVTALRDNGHIASMTGDGVNDAPALKAADIGVAMGITGTDVSKNAADMILMDDNFATIVKAVEQGRIIYANIRKFVSFLLSCNVGEILVIFLLSLIPNSIVPGIAAPLTAIQLLWLNLVTDSFPALALGREEGEPGIMKLPPRPKNEPIINKSMLASIAAQAVAIFVSVATAFIAALTTKGTFFFNTEDTLTGARTVAFATLILAELFRAYASRSERMSVFKLGLFTNKLMNAAVAISLVLLAAVIYIPGINGIFDNVALNLTAWIAIIPLAFIPFTVSEVFKLIKSKINK